MSTRFQNASGVGPPLSARWTAIFGYWLYLERAGAGGLGGWIAPRAALDVDFIEVQCGGARFRVPLNRDPATLDGRALYRFHCPLPFPRVSVVTLGVGKHSLSLLAIGRKRGQAPIVAPAPPQPWRTTAPRATPRARALVVLAPIDWCFRRQRSQQLTLALSKHYERTFYLGPASLQLTGAAVEAEGGRVSLPLLGAAPDCDFAQRALTGAEAAACADGLRALLGDARVDVLAQFPSWQKVTRLLPEARLVYDCIDRHAQLPHVTASIDEAEARLTQEAQLCLATSGPLMERLASLSANARLLVPNATLAPRMDVWPAQRDPVIVYLGAVEPWFDFDLVDSVAKALPNATVRIVGALGVVPPASLARNIVFTGEQDHDAAMCSLTRARVGIVPFRRDALIDAVNPVKVYEYMAAGLPVIMTTMGGAELASAPGIAVADTFETFAAAAARAYAMTTDADRRACAHWAGSQTWSARSDAIAQALNAG